MNDGDGTVDEDLSILLGGVADPEKAKWMRLLLPRRNMGSKSYPAWILRAIRDRASGKSRSPSMRIMAK